MKQIIIVTNQKDRYEREIPEDLYVTWCEFSVSALIKIRNRSNLIFLLMDHEKHDALDEMAIYLRDLCIEDEKYIYMYGNKEDVDTMRSKIPSLFIKKSMYSFSHFDILTDIIIQEEVIAENGRPVFLLIDNDSEYGEKLRVFLDPYFRVVVCRFDTAEIYKLVMMADIVLISLAGTMRLYDFMELFRIIAAKSKTQGFHYYYITDTDLERNARNSGSDKSSIAFSKEMDVERTAKYFISKAGS
ncbi:MAG: hypothetical protein K6G58_05365 [Lachnospiraceae bacterium]|nr:hypothetical protein [Lachnospiraceae bacterium]